MDLDFDQVIRLIEILTHTKLFYGLLALRFYKAYLKNRSHARDQEVKLKRITTSKEVALSGKAVITSGSAEDFMMASTSEEGDLPEITPNIDNQPIDNQESSNTSKKQNKRRVTLTGPVITKVLDLLLVPSKIVLLVLVLGAVMIYFT